MSKPYVGITGFTGNHEIAKCLENVPHGHKRVFMVGILVSDTTINGRENSLGLKFPKREEIAEIFVDDPRTLNTLHVATREPKKLYDLLYRCFDYCDGMLDAFQLNIVYPDQKAVERIKSEIEGLKFIFQISPHLEQYQGKEPKTIAAEINQIYGGLADYYLIDFSRGFGQELNPDQIGRYLNAFYEIDPEANMSVGGGLKADNLERLIKPLLKKYPELSWDAEGGLRNNYPGGGTMMMNDAREYMIKSYSFF